MTSYQIKIRQFTAKFPGKTPEELVKHLEYVRSEFKSNTDKTVRQRYEDYLDLLKRKGIDKTPSFTSYKYVVYYKEPFSPQHISG